MKTCGCPAPCVQPRCLLKVPLILGGRAAARARAAPAQGGAAVGRAPPVPHAPRARPAATIPGQPRRAQLTAPGLRRRRPVSPLAGSRSARSKRPRVAGTRPTERARTLTV